VASLVACIGSEEVEKIQHTEKCQTILHQKCSDDLKTLKPSKRLSQDTHNTSCQLGDKKKWFYLKHLRYERAVGQ
jgi:hypothetical protein